MTTSSDTSQAAPPARSRRHRGPGVLLAAVTAVTLLAGCGLLSPSSSGTLLEEGTTEVEVDTGETVQVSLGSGSQGIGDAWGVVSQTDDAVAEAQVVMDEEVLGAEGGEEAPGASMPYAVEITGLAAGTSTVRVLYCTRAEIAEDCDQSQGTLEPPVAPVEITVTVG